MEPTRVRFVVTEAMVDAFARLTGDWNSLHMNEEVARKSRYRRRIVHGMLPFSMLHSLQCSYPRESLRFEKISVRFQQPIHTGDEIELEITTEGDNFKASWHKAESGELVTRAKGRFALRAKTGAPLELPASAKALPFLSTDLEEATFSIGELKDRVESFQMNFSHASVADYAAQIGSALGDAAGEGMCPNLLATLMLGTLVGMRLPGRYATFTGFEIEFERDIEEDHSYLLQGSVTQVSETAEILATRVLVRDAAAPDDEERGRLATGKIDAMVNSAPKSMLSCDEIRANHTALGVEDQVVVVTGASRGIGETTAKLFAMLGAKVVVNYYRGAQDAERIAAEIQEAGGQALALRCDIRDDAEVETFFAAVIEHWGAVDVLVNNAVKDFSPKPLADSVWSDYLDEMEVSIKGMHACCRAAIPHMKARGGGKIVNLSSVAVDNPVSGQSRYITAKSAVLGYTKSLAVELAKFGIQANVIVPNMTDTDLIASIPTAYRDKLAASRPSKRHVQPIEVAQAVVFVASKWSSAITGQKVVLNLGEPPFA
jgi:3-oxoacyl-[acyl-carrier protein] reductase